MVLLLSAGEWNVNRLSIRLDIFSTFTVRKVSARESRAVCLDAIVFSQFRYRENFCCARDLLPTRFSVRFGSHRWCDCLLGRDAIAFAHFWGTFGDGPKWNTPRRYRHCGSGGGSVSVSATHHCGSPASEKVVPCDVFGSAYRSIFFALGTFGHRLFPIHQRFLSCLHLSTFSGNGYLCHRMELRISQCCNPQRVGRSGGCFKSAPDKCLAPCDRDVGRTPVPTLDAEC